MTEALTTSQLGDPPAGLEYSPSAPPAGAMEIQKLAERERQALLKQIGTLKLTKIEQAALMVEATDADIEILPTGEVYAPGAAYRKILNTAIGPTGWGVRPGAIHLDLHNKTANSNDKGKSILYREIFLIIRGKCVSTAIGQQDYHPTNARMTYADAAEGAVTNGVMRCCKPLGVYGNIWDRGWADEARNRVGILVLIKDGQWTATQWRRFDSAPFTNRDGNIVEMSVHPNSPNKDKWTPAVKPAQPSQAAGQPAAAAAPAADVVDADAGFTILNIRKVQYPATETRPAGEYWVVTTDGGDFVTNVADNVKILENAKARRRKVVFKSEKATTSQGIMNMIVEFRVA